MGCGRVALHVLSILSKAVMVVLEEAGFCVADHLEGIP
jgi:hypothetical protein